MPTLRVVPRRLAAINVKAIIDQAPRMQASACAPPSRADPPPPAVLGR
jgi:hypothetical protein